MSIDKTHIITEEPISNRIKLFYLGGYVLLAALFIKLLFTQIMQSFFQEDLLWFIPAVFRATQGLSFKQLIIYFLNPRPIWFAVPMLKAYAFLVLSLFGPLAKYFIFVSLAFHFGSSFLVFSVSRKLRLHFRVSMLAALTYLVLFTQFAAYLWPMAFQHLWTVFFILLGFDFYLKTDGLIQERKKFLAYLLITLLINFIASLSRFSNLILPAMVVTHIILSCDDCKERVRRYDIWLPLFIVYLIYPSVLIAFGDPRAWGMFRPLQPFLARYGLDPEKIAVPVKLGVLFFSGLCGLSVFRFLLLMSGRRKARNFIKLSLGVALILGVMFLLFLGGVKRLLIPYNLMVPFVGTFGAFLQPLRNALLVDSTRLYYFIPLELGAFNFLFSFLILAVFIKYFVLANRKLAVLFIFYCLDLFYLYLWDPIASRYFIYLSPLFSIIFCASVYYLYTRLVEKTRLRRITREIILIAVFITLGAENLLAINLSLFRGKMVNTFYAYDYIRAAKNIKGDLASKGILKDARKIYINNVFPVVFTYREDFPAADHYYDNVKFVFMQAFNDKTLEVIPNQTPQQDTNIVYSLDGYRINDRKGNDISRFSQLLEEALYRLGHNQNKEAGELFLKAVAERPFLLNYLLGGLKLEDAQWLTNGSDLRTWIRKLVSFYCQKRAIITFKRTSYVSGIINKEIDDYIRCLFYLSYLEYASGSLPESEYRFSQIGFLENDYQRLYFWLAQEPLVKNNIQISSFLESCDNISLNKKPENYIDRFKFGSFLFRRLANAF